jgi:hypothetical protein
MYGKLDDGGKRFYYKLSKIFDTCVMRSSTIINGLYGADPDKKKFFITNENKFLFDDNINHVKDIVFYPISILAKNREEAAIIHAGVESTPPNPIVPSPITGLITNEPIIHYLVDAPVNWSENLTSLIDNTLFDMLVLKSLHKIYQNLGHMELAELFRGQYEDSYSYLRSVLNYRTKQPSITYRGF